MASDRKMETRRRRRRFVSRWNECRVATITRKPPQKMTAAFSIHRVESSFSSAGDGMREAYAGTMGTR
jgi:hypothetical protein